MDARGQLGLHDELQATVDAWPDELYRGNDWNDHYHAPQAIVFGLGSPQAVESAFKRLGLGFSSDWHVAGWLAHTELDHLEYAGDRIGRLTNKDEAEAAMRVFTRVHDPAVAPVMLDLTRGSRAPAMARDWMTEHPLETAVGLARTLAVRARPEVVEFLRTRKRAGDDLTAALPHLDEASAARLTDLVIAHEDPAGNTLAREELPPALQAALGTPPKKLPGFVDPAALPPIVVGGEGRLDPDAVACVLHACTQLKPGESIPPLLAAVREHADAEAFAWGLFESWLGDGAPSKHKWAMLAMGPLGGDTTATRLAPMIRTWPGESQHARAVLGLERARDDRHGHGADAAQRHRREGQVQGAPAACPGGDGRDRRRQGHDEGGARGPDRA